MEFTSTQYQYISAMLQMTKALLELHGIGNETLDSFIEALYNGEDIIFVYDEDEEDEDEDDIPDLFKRITE
jgi:endonuclease III-like uncharacterized protein